MAWALLDQDQNIVGIIIYDGLAPYTPAEGLILKQVSADLQIGDYGGAP